MKKIQFIFSCLFFVSISLVAQPTPTQGTTEYGKVQVPCYNLEVPYPTDVAEDAIKKRFKQMGASGKEHKGFYEYKNVRIPQVRESLVDAYIKVERKGKKDKTASIVTMILTEPGQEPGTTANADNVGAGAAIASVGALGMLSSLSDNTEDLSIDLDIKNKEEAVKKADKEYKNLIEDGNDLESKLNKIQNEIERNKAEQIKMSETLTQKRELLVAAQGRKKMTPGEKKN